ncbi:MAG: UDP-N-acetylglucosamine 2-epimerase (non-hydrolyzing) [Anaerolineae bacterium]|nr:UDP-N-acetylglucosamine 2-epimerase (non-hydrolyzing) [Anaerolineae bacterium]
MALKIVNIVGARPNLIKMAPLMKAMGQVTDIEAVLLHTGQHYDHAMSQIFFDELSLPEPDVFLNVGSASHAVQTAKIMVAFEQFALDWQPDLVLVVGDVNSTLACAITAAKLNLPVAHVEAGLRSFDRTMPEEVNRIVTDALSDLLFTTSQGANEHLLREGIDPNKIFFVGNVMIDTLREYQDQMSRLTILDEFKVEPGNYLLLTLHRPGAVDNRDVFAGILEAIKTIQHDIPIVFPVHPRTAKRIEEHNLTPLVRSMPNLTRIEPLPYLSMLHTMAHAKAVLTDSGGIQEETTVLGVPCLTLRENTERPITVTEGTNKVIGTRPERILAETRHLLQAELPPRTIPALWDGHTSERIVQIICDKMITPGR